MSDGTLQTLDITMLDDVGTGANQLIQLDSNAKIPACSAAAVTNLPSITKSSSDPTISTNPSGGVGTVFQNTTSGEMYVCTDATAGANVWTNVGAGSGDIRLAWYGGRAVMGGGYVSGDVDTMDYFAIATPGNATDFGDLTDGRRGSDAVSNGTRGLWGGGRLALVDTIDYVTIASTGNAIDFGDLTTVTWAVAACSNGIRGVWGGGMDTTTTSRNVIDYVTIATIGNALDFGDLTEYRRGFASCSNGTRGIWGGGYRDHSPSGYHNIIDYVTIASTGNALDFGDLSGQHWSMSAVASVTRGIFAGGSTSAATINIIEYVTIATPGNATDFGDMIGVTYGMGGAHNADRGVFAGGWTSGYINTIQYITMASTGNATDFGDLTTARGEQPGGCSGD